MKLKKVFLLLIILNSFLCFGYSQKAKESVSEETVITATENSTVENPEKRFVIADSQNQLVSPKKTSGVWIFIRMILVLALVIVIIYFLMNFFKKSVNGGSGTDDPYLRKVAHLNLGPGKSVQVVTLLENCFVLGVSDSGINLIGEIDDKELISAMNVSADTAASTQKAKTFAEVLEMFMPSKSSHETSATRPDIYSDVSENVQEFVKKQRKRINKKDE